MAARARDPSATPSRPASPPSAGSPSGNGHTHGSPGALHDTIGPPFSAAGGPAWSTRRPSVDPGFLHAAASPTLARRRRSPSRAARPTPNPGQRRRVTDTDTDRVARPTSRPRKDRRRRCSVVVRTRAPPTSSPTADQRRTEQRHRRDRHRPCCQPASTFVWQAHRRRRPTTPRSNAVHYTYRDRSAWPRHRSAPRRSPSPSMPAATSQRLQHHHGQPSPAGTTDASPGR